jgi:taurine dioxygenase
MEPLTFRRLAPSLGAVVEGIDLSGERPAEIKEWLEAALDEHLVLFFENQRLTPRQQRDLAAAFGPLYLHPFYPGMADAAEVMLLENDANRPPSADRWHNDVTFLEKPPKIAVLYSEVIPELGGDTLWANMYQAFSDLSAPLQTLLQSLRAEHSFAKNFTPERFARIGMEDRMAELYAKHPSVSHPVARRNKKTGRYALYVNQDFTTKILGVSPRESAALLTFLFEHMEQPQYQVRWRWKPDTLVMWDNRWTQHCALGDYYPNHRRMRRATVLDEEPV